MDENERTLQTLHMTPGNSSVSSETVFHAVYIPEENVDSSTENNSKENIRVYQDKAEALKVIKEFKTGRLKSFKKLSEAEEYARTGFEKANYINNKSAPIVVPVAEEKSNNFKAPQPQELICFKKLIHYGDLYDVKTTVWANPRYLIGSGDTPAILQEGCRYNALHIAVKAGRPDMFKFGLKDVVRVLVSYPCCIKTLPNKYKQLPIDIICSRTFQEDEELKKEIRFLLEEQYYVPVLRSDDNSLQPVIGEPFSPTSPLSLNTDPISPRLEVRAFAGPMTKSRALEFRKKWKTPPRLHMTPIKRKMDDEPNIANSPINNITLRLQDAEKGLERVGRDLAEEYQVSWKEYWPFLNDFADFRTTEGLMKLEKYLEYKFQDQLFHYHQTSNDNKTKSNENTKTQAVTDIDYLCNKLKSCSLLTLDMQDQNNVDELEFFTPPSSPKLMVDSSDDEMQNAEERPGIFLEGPVPTKLDYAVYNAVSTSLNSTIYPNIYLWQHDMQLAMACDIHRINNMQTIRRKLIMN
ncbi:unnamed protein product [Xylocopa violacea]|uniref:ANKLE2 third alpha/beta domain-containing protein n=1 Tax=Xylocopa violacea TaxID=135666 RepID=A0ABP1NVS7_XYLVO